MRSGDVQNVHETGTCDPRCRDLESPHRNQAGRRVLVDLCVGQAPGQVFLSRPGVIQVHAGRGAKRPLHVPLRHHRRHRWCCRYRRGLHRRQLLRHGGAGSMMGGGEVIRAYFTLHNSLEVIYRN